ncbi:MAG: low molecular weight phosphatase family protein [Thermoplasmata archaeon]|nr:low molecular weight phosphatase family protein [Thermoplasmata archaeon]
MNERTVLFVCVENAGRSLMAEAIFNAHPAPGWRATSGGTRPATEPHPRTRTLLAEIGLTLPAHAPQLATPEMIEAATVRISMGCLDDASCPANLKALKMSDWELPDPARLDDAGARGVRDEIRSRMQVLRTELVLRDRRLRALELRTQ